MTKNEFGRLEAVLFACGEPMEISRLAAGLSLETAALREQLLAYREQLEKDSRGIALFFLGDCVQLGTRPEYADAVREVLAVKKNTPLSPASLEVLAVAAYNQPVTKGFIEQVRGVESGQLVNNLVEKGLLEEAGRLDGPGRPILYRTTPNFLRCFGLESLEDLPPAEAETRAAEEEDHAAQLMM